jgi:hypothetical protein
MPAACGALGAFARVTGASWRARPLHLRAAVPALGAVAGAACPVPVPVAAARARHPVPVFGAGGRVTAAVAITGPPELPADLDRARVQVHVLPQEPDCLGLPDAHRERDRPASAARPVRGGGQDAARLVAAQRLDISLLTDRGIDKQGHVAAGLPALPGDLQRAGQDPVDLLIWFDRSAHLPNAEERGLFNKIMVEEILPIAARHSTP